VERACEDIAAQLAGLGESVGWPIQVTPVGLPLKQLNEDLGQHDYQLAYHCLDYRSEAYWLGPLFDTRPEALAKGGTNFLGYEDAELQKLFQGTLGRRDFAEVRKQTHALHARLHQRMPLIPLWQLDTHVGLHPSLRPTHLDPLLIFDDVANWKLEK
jgi:ABC-type oligopeptide transport system substrate-binding subunit